MHCLYVHGLHLNQEGVGWPSLHGWAIYGHRGRDLIIQDLAGWIEQVDKCEAMLEIAEVKLDSGVIK